MTKYAGSCLCGQVSFEIEGAFQQFMLCHCRYCQKDTGSAHAANLFSGSAAVRWLSGEEQVSTFKLPGTRHQRSFCANCGSALPTIQQGIGVVVPAGSLDGDTPMMPRAHIFMGSRADWDRDLENVDVFDAFPEMNDERGG